MGLEKLVKNRRVRKMQFVDDFLDRHVGILQHVLGFQDDEGINPLRAGFSAGILDDLRKIFRGEAEFVGVERHAAFPVMVLRNKLEELLQEEFRAHGLFSGGFGAFDRQEFLLPDGACIIQAGRYDSPQDLLDAFLPALHKHVYELEILQEDRALVSAHLEAGIVQHGNAFVEHLHIIHARTGQEIAGNRNHYEVQPPQLVLVYAVDAADVAREVDDYRVLPDIVGLEIDFGLEFSFQAEYRQVPIQTARVIKYVQNCIVADFRYEEVVGQSVSDGAGEVFRQVAETDFVKVAVHARDCCFRLQS